LLLIWPDQVHPSHAAGAGVCLAAAAYFKGMALYFAPLAAVWILVWGGTEVEPDALASLEPCPRGRFTALRRRWPAAAVLVATMLLVLAPWTARNWRSYHRFLLLDATAGRNLYIGTNLAPPSNWDLGFNDRRRIHGGRPRCRSANIVDADRCEVGHALEFIKKHPGHMLSRIPLKLADLLSPSSFLIRHIRLGKYPYPFSPWQVKGLTLAAALTWMGVAGLGLLGLFLSRSSGALILLRLLLGYELLLHSLTFGMTRFRLPMVSFLILAAASFTACRPAHEMRQASVWRLGAAGLFLGFLGLLWASRWSTVFDIF
ncbi:MAG: hypothetical protein ACE5ID_11200, partial [Acidobacteriota bacterium]